jgi:hypothetical protein
MATETSSIDDILAGGIPKSVPPPPVATVDDDSRETSDLDIAHVEDLGAPQDEYGLQSQNEPHEEQPSSENEQVASKPSIETDEYGNEKAAARTYTQDEADEYANRIVRERLSRLERNNAQLTPSQQQQAKQQGAQGFEYNSENPETWEQQLEQFVEKAFYKIGQREQQQSQQMKERQLQAEFEDRFYKGASKFGDFKEVITALNVDIPDTVTKATRAMKDPAAFLYAAAKRAPEELKNIARIEDPFAQVLALGKLEEKMKMTKPTTKTPRPVGRTQEDSHAPSSKSKREPTIEEMIAHSDAKRRALNEQRRRR